MKIVEYGKKFIIGGTTDFIVLASSDEKIASSVDYFRRSILSFPSKTSFNDNVGKVTCGFFTFQEGYLFVQIQSRREDEIEGEKSRMKRPYIQSRFSFLTKEEYVSLLKDNIAVYTSLLFNNQLANKKGHIYKLPDYGFFNEEEINPLSSEWKSMDNGQNFLESHSLYDNKEIEYTINQLYENFNSQFHKSKKIELPISLKHANNENSHYLPYILHVLQKAQQELYPTCGEFSFVLDNISNQRVNIRVHQGNPEHISKLKYSARKKIETINTYRSVYDQTFSIYYGNSVDLEEIELIYKSVFDSKLPDIERKRVINKNFRLVEQAGDFDRSLELLSTSSRIEWAIEERKAEGVGSKIWLYLSKKPDELLLACSSISDLDIKSEPAKLLIHLLPQYTVDDLRRLSESQYHNFWKFSFDLYINIPTTKFVEGKNILELFCDLVFSKNISYDIKPLFWRIITDSSSKLDLSSLHELGLSKCIIVIERISELTLDLPTTYTNSKDIQETLAQKILSATINIPDFVFGDSISLYQTTNTRAEDLKHITKIVVNAKRLFQNDDVSILNLAAFSPDKLDHFSKLCNWLVLNQNDFIHFWLLETLRIAHKDTIMFKKHYLNLRDATKAATTNLYPSQIYEVMQIEDAPQKRPLNKVLSELFNIPPNYIFHLALLDIWLSEPDISKNFLINIDDLIMVINILTENANVFLVKSANNILIKVAKEQKDNCKLLPSDTALRWLDAATQKRAEQGFADEYYLYPSYSDYTKENNRNNHLFDLINGLEKPSAELIWKISSLPEVSDFSNEVAQNYLSLWNNKFNLAEEKHQLLEVYLIELTAITQKAEVTGSLMAILRNLVELSFGSGNYLCKNDNEALWLLSINTLVKNPGIKILAENSIQTYLRNSNNLVSDNLITHLLMSGVPVGPTRIKNYISNLVTEKRLKTQLAALNTNGVLQIYKNAPDVSMNINIVQLIEARLQEIGVNIPQPSQQLGLNPQKVDEMISEQIANVENESQDNALESEKERSSEGSSEEMPKGTTTTKEDNGYIKVDKVVFYSTIGFLVVFVVLDIILLISYMQLLGLFQTLEN